MFRNINPCYWALGLRPTNINLHIGGVNIKHLLKSIKLFGVHLALNLILVST